MYIYIYIYIYILYILDQQVIELYNNVLFMAHPMIAFPRVRTINNYSFHCFYKKRTSIFVTLKDGGNMLFELKRNHYS